MKVIPALVICLISTSALVDKAQAENVSFSSKEQLCEYLENKKEAAEDAMKAGYSASQYNRLEKQRKYWKKEYMDKCF